MATLLIDLDMVSLPMLITAMPHLSCVMLSLTLENSPPIPGVQSSERCCTVIREVGSPGGLALLWTSIPWPGYGEVH